MLTRKKKQDQRKKGSVEARGQMYLNIQDCWGLELMVSDMKSVWLCKWMASWSEGRGHWR